MNKTFAFLAALLLIAAGLRAQDDASVRFGLKLSPNLSFIKPETRGLKSNGPGFGYTFGLMVDLPIGSTGNYFFATGLNLNSMKGKWKSDYQYVADANPSSPVLTKELATDVALQYVELPLTVKLMTQEVGYMRYYAVVGAGNAFNVKAKSNQVAPRVDGVRADGRPIVSAFEEIDGENIQSDIVLYKASLVVGAGVEYNFSGNTSALFGLTFNNGFTNLLDIDKLKARAHYLELTLGVYF